MAIFEVTADALLSLTPTTFAAQRLRERFDLQRLLRQNIGAIDPGLFVLTEEYADWEDSRRRIDLLCIDKKANIVVLELKRTEDAGRAELQAIRYAAMVSRMTFAQAVMAHTAYLARIGESDDAEAAILRFLDWDEPDESNFGQDTRIIIVSHEFSKELTTSVLWLNQRELDIRCVRMVPYAHADKVYVDIQQVIPLPEAADYEIQVRKKAAEERTAREGEGPDWTRYDLEINGERFEHLNKRRLFLKVIQGLCTGGISPQRMCEFLPERKLLEVDGICSGEEFLAKASAARKRNGNLYNLKRFFTEDSDLMHFGGKTYALSNQWSMPFLPGLEELIKSVPQQKISFHPSDKEAED